MFGLLMASDRRFLDFCRLALASVRLHNADLPICLFTCDEDPDMAALAREQNCDLRTVPRPAFAHKLGGEAEQATCWNRAAKLTALAECPFDTALYVDADTIAFADPARVLCLSPGGLAPEDVYLLLRRPRNPSVYEWRKPYIRNSETMDPDEVAALLSQGFGRALTAACLDGIRCWNGGVVFGSQKALRRLGRLWLETYAAMLSGPERHRYPPKDQLCLWLAADQLGTELRFHELPLAWNYMIAHVHKQRVRSFSVENVLALAGSDFELLHLGDAKDAEWVAGLRARIPGAGGCGE